MRRRVTLRQSVPSQGRTETPQKTSDCLGNLRVDETNIDDASEATLERIPCIRKVNAIHPTFAKELGLRVRPIALFLGCLLTLKHKKLTAPRWIPMNVHVLRTSSWHQIMTTSWSSHHRGTRLQQAQRPSIGLEQGALEAYKEDYFKINASPKNRW